MKKKHLVWLILISFIISSSAAAIFYGMLNSPIERKEIQMYLKVAENPGVNTDTDALYFGRVPPEGSSTRQFSISNNMNYSIKAILIPKGELALWTSVSENKILLKPKEAIGISITAYVPSGAKLGNYTGTLAIEMRKA